MPSSSATAPARKGAAPPRPRLYLFTPRLDETSAFAAALAPVLPAGDIAAVLLRLNEADERSLIDRVKTIAAVVQARDIALLVEGRADIVTRSGADGAHLTGIAALRAALPSLKPDHIAGVGGLRSRHDAMLAGEADADYVMFGEPLARAVRHAGGADVSRPPLESIEERLAWWSELFQPSCIGYAASAQEVAVLAQAGADFVALGDWIWTQSGGAEAVVADAAERLAAARAS